MEISPVRQAAFSESVFSQNQMANYMLTQKNLILHLHLQKPKFPIEEILWHDRYSPLYLETI
jgi:hypothetical protein